MHTRERGRDLAIVLLAMGLAVAAGALLSGPLRHTGPASPALELPWWALVPVFTATELLVVHVQARRETLSISFAELPLVLGLAFCDPIGYVAASVLGSAAGLLYHRQFGLKLPFNLAMFALEAALAQTLYHAVLSGGDPASGRGFAAALLTIVVTQAVSAALLTAVIYLKAGRFDEGVLAEAMSSALVAALANSSIGLLVVVLLVTRPSALVLVLVVIATLVLVYRGYSALSSGHARLEALYRFTDRTGSAVSSAALSEAVLNEARDVLSAEAAELVILADAGVSGTHLRLSGSALIEGVTSEQDTWWRDALTGNTVLFARTDNNAMGQVRDGLAAPLKVNDTVVGVLVVADRPHHLETFVEADLRLFASLANHASLSLHKAHLLDQLRAEAAVQEHQSLHDALTGLPNRRYFLRSVAEALAAGTPVAVVMLDLDGFKDINEALGHATGDLLLTEVGARLSQRLGLPFVARLGNDEFAVLLPQVRDEADVMLQAQPLVTALAQPFLVHGLRIDVRVTAGVAHAPDHGRDAATLLQRADIALYAAKQHQTAFEVYDPATDSASTRLEMTGHLRRDIERRALGVHFQPKVDPASGLVLGAEALVRWQHPEYGFVSPDIFIPLAEQTGLIRPLTALVLRESLQRCARWRAAGHRIGVAVNLSTRSLTDEQLPQEVRHALAEADLPAAALTLEITETDVMTDLNRSLAVLHELRALGVRLSVDDFGTGQSSLAYLKRLPVDEVKIDKSFVMGLAGAQGDAAIVRAAIELAHALELRVVAEGVEDEATQILLANWGCDVIQGYHISRPLPDAGLLEWLSSRESCRSALAVPHPRRPPQRTTDQAL